MRDINQNREPVCELTSRQRKGVPTYRDKNAAASRDGSCRRWYFLCGVGPHRYFCQRTQSFSVDFDEGSREGIARHHAAMLTKSYFYEGYRRENGSATCTLRRLPEMSRIRVLLSKSSSTISFDFCHFSVKLFFFSITSTRSARDIQSSSMTVI